MDVAITIVMLVPVLLAVALIIGVIRRNVTERQAGDPVDISGAIPAVIVLMVAVLIIVAMGNAASPYVYDEESGELTIQKNVPQLDIQPWDSYASEVKSLIIEDNVTIGAGAFDTMTSLEYLKIGEGVSLGSGVFGVTLEDYTGATISAPSAGEYVGEGDDTLYYCDESIYTYTTDGTGITGLGSGVSSEAMYLVLPSAHDGRTISKVSASAFANNAAIAFVATLPGSSISSVQGQAFDGCAALVTVKMSEATSVGFKSFNGCAALVTVEMPKLASVGTNGFSGCSALASMTFDSVTRISNSGFSGCRSLTELDAPLLIEINNSGFYACGGITIANIPSIQTLGSSVFYNCTSIQEVKLGPLTGTYSANAFPAWTFYESDGTTEIDKSVAANLAGKTFQGTASALVEVSPGLLSLTPQQLQQVHLHDAELQDLKDHLTIDPLPFQPSLQTEQEQVAA